MKVVGIITLKDVGGRMIKMGVIAIMERTRTKNQNHVTWKLRSQTFKLH
jgi:hypothetical protein